MAMVVGFLNLTTGATVLAKDEAGCGRVETGIIKCENENGLEGVLGMALTIMTYGVGIAATIGIVLSGYEYLTARDNAGKIVKAKERIFYVVIGLLMYALLWGMIQFLMPGDLKGRLEKIRERSTVQEEKKEKDSGKKEESVEREESTNDGRATVKNNE